LSGAIKDYVDVIVLPFTESLAQAILGFNNLAGSNILAAGFTLHPFGRFWAAVFCADKSIIYRYMSMSNGRVTRAVVPQRQTVCLALK